MGHYKIEDTHPAQLDSRWSNIGIASTTFWQGFISMTVYKKSPERNEFCKANRKNDPLCYQIQAEIQFEMFFRMATSFAPSVRPWDICFDINVVWSWSILREEAILRERELGKLCTILFDKAACNKLPRAWQSYYCCKRVRQQPQKREDEQAHVLAIQSRQIIQSFQKLPLHCRLRA